MRMKAASFVRRRKRWFGSRMRLLCHYLPSRIERSSFLKFWPYLAGLSVIFLIFLLMSCQDAGVHIVCVCDSTSASEVRVRRHIRHILQETDETNRSALDLLKKEHPSFPVEFLLHQEMRGERCSLVPGLFDIRHNNKVWQEARVRGDTFLIYSAHYDNRDAINGPMVRIVAVVDSTSPAVPACNIYHSLDLPPVSTKAVDLAFLHWQYPQQGAWQPYLISCKAGSLVPLAVSLVSYTCQPATNAVIVQYGNIAIQFEKDAVDTEWYFMENKSTVNNGTFQNRQREKRKDLALCHKFLFNDLKDESLRLIEWLEAARAWGVDSVTLYVDSAHPKVLQVLELYQKQGFITVLPWTNPGHYPNIAGLQRAFYDTQRYALFTLENIPYTDCFLRHVNSHRYVAVWDIDEFLIPSRPFDRIPHMLDHSKVQWLRAHAKECLPVYLEYPQLTYLINLIYELQAVDLTNSYSTTELEMFAEMIDQIKTVGSIPVRCKPPTSYLGRCTYFFNRYVDPYPTNNTGEVLHMLSHVTRSVKFVAPLVHTKAVHDTSRALGLHSHFALYNVDGPQDRHFGLYSLYPASEGYLAHYRETCQGEDQSECDRDFKPYLTRDERMRRHGEAVAQRVKDTVSRLFLV